CKRLFAGSLGVICLLGFCHQMLALLGASLPVTTAMCAALIAGVAAAARCMRLARAAAIPRHVFAAAMYFGLAALAVFYPTLIDAAGWLLARPGFISLNSAAWNGGAVFALAILLLGAPACLVTCLAIELTDS